MLPRLILPFSHGGLPRRLAQNKQHPVGDASRTSRGGGTCLNHALNDRLDRTSSKDASRPLVPLRISLKPETPDPITCKMAPKAIEPDAKIPVSQQPSSGSFLSDLVAFVFVLWLEQPADPHASLFTSRDQCTTLEQLQNELYQLETALAPEEREDTWEKMERAILRFAAITRGGAYKLGEPYIKSLGAKANGTKLVSCVSHLLSFARYVFGTVSTNAQHAYVVDAYGTWSIVRCRRRFPVNNGATSRSNLPATRTALRPCPCPPIRPPQQGLLATSGKDIDDTDRPLSLFQHHSVSSRRNRGQIGCHATNFKHGRRENH